MSWSVDSEEKPFLDHEKDDEDEIRATSRRGGSQSSQRQLLFLSTTLNAVLLVLSISLGIALSSSWKPQDIPSASDQSLPDKYSPANNIIEYEYRAVNQNDTRYLGYPTPAWEDEMHRLMEGTLLRMSQDEIDLLGSDSIPLEKGGYAAGLGVAHNLHCVKKVKKFLYQEHFYSDLDQGSDEFQYTQAHADHCLDWLRQSIMCHVDYTVYTLYWGERRQDIPTHTIPPPQKCVNWDKLHQWMLSRAASTDELIRPEN